MNPVKQLVAGLLYFVILSVLLLGSCAGSGIMYAESPRWFLEDIDHDKTPGGTFFVAFMADDDAGNKQLKVMMPKNIDEKKYLGSQYYMPEQHQTPRWAKGTASATVDVISESQGSQLIHVFVRGDSPWSSLSEYRVEDNKIVPLRHGKSVGWFLLGFIIGPMFVSHFSKRIKRRIYHLLKLET